jgi:AGCS family alanine or glycine:cation symporter
MWVVGFIGMALKMTEVTQSMLYRNTEDPENPHGGPMFVISHGLREMAPSLATLGRWIGYVFCVTVLISAVTGGKRRGRPRAARRPPSPQARRCRSRGRR